MVYRLIFRLRLTVFFSDLRRRSRFRSTLAFSLIEAWYSLMAILARASLRREISSCDLKLMMSPMSLAFGNCFSSSGVSSRDMTHLPPNAIKLHLVWLKAINLGMTIKMNIDAEDDVFPIDLLNPDEDNFSGDAAAQYAGANAHPYLSYHAALGLLLKSMTCFLSRRSSQNRKRSRMCLR